MAAVIIAIDKKGALSMRTNSNFTKSAYRPDSPVEAHTRLSTKDLITEITKDSPKRLTKKEKAEQELAVFSVLNRLEVGEMLYVDTMAEDFKDDVRLSWKRSNQGWVPQQTPQKETT